MKYGDIMPTIKAIRGFVIRTGQVASIGDIIKDVPEALVKTLIHTGKAEIYVPEPEVELKREPEMDDDDNEDFDDDLDEDDNTDTDPENHNPETHTEPEIINKVTANPLIQRQTARKNQATTKPNSKKGKKK